jgi:hypothetical protein
MCGQKIAATIEQPTQFINGNIQLVGRHHLADFFQVLGAIQRAARVNQFPGVLLAARSAHADHAATAAGRRVVARLFRWSFTLGRHAAVLPF